MSWINVKDKLPEKNSDVLVVYHPYGDKEKPVIYAVCRVNDYLDFFSSEAEEYIEYVTHWQPLLQPPKGDNDE